MDNWAIEKIHEMPIIHQMANIGGEVCVAIRWKNRGHIQRMTSHCNLAIKFLECSISDPKNTDRKEELEFRIEELEDYFFGDNKYNTTDESLIDYYNFFIFQYP